jgi:two-component system, NtrC family, sensor kinase
MQKLFRCALLICLVLIYKEGFSQRLEEINSLKHELPNAQNDSTRALITADISYWFLSINPDSSIYYGEQALSIAQKIKFYRGECMALAHLGNAVRFKGDIPGGMQLLMKALEISKVHGYTFESAYAIGRIGAIYLDNLKDYDKALTYFKLAHQVKVSDSERISRLFQIPLNMNTGMVYKHKGKMDSALLYMEKAYSLVNPSVSSFKPVVQMYMADLQFEMGNREVALALLRQCLTFHNNEELDFRMSSEAANIMSNFFIIMNQPDSSIFYAKLALEKAKIIDHKQQILTAYNLLAELYEPRDLHQAYEYLKYSKEINNELYGAEKVQSFQRIIISDLERQRKIEAERVVYQDRIRLYFLLTGLGVFLLIFFIQYRNNRQKQKANKVLEATLSNLKSTQSQLIQSEKMASLGELTAGIAHEIQNPLNFVNNFSEVSNELLDEMKAELDKGDTAEAKAIAEDVKQNLEKILHHGRRADGIVKGMLQHSRTSSGVKEPTDINALADEYLRLAYHGLRAKDKSFNATMITDYDPAIGNINIVPQDIGRVILNLITNAFYVVNERKNSGPENYEPTVSVSTKKIDGKILISVKDNGSGIPQKVLDKIFQPFFTTKPTGQGTGLGLSLSYDIVKAHGGKLKVETKEGEGSIFTIQVPIA